MRINPPNISALRFVPHFFACALATTLPAQTPSAPSPNANSSGLPVNAIEEILEIKGDVTNGVLELEVEREDIKSVQGPSYAPVTFTPSFELNGDIFFQPLSGGQAFMNGDIPLKENEINNFISSLLSNGLVFQGFHQHLPMHPQIWFVHFRGKGDPKNLAHAVRAAINTTDIPLPQAPPPHRSTPLQPGRLAQILHGVASVGSGGVVTVWVYRRDEVMIDGVHVNPQANISTNVEFKPLGGSRAVAVSDFSMKTGEVVPVVTLMLNQFGFAQGCLYNQETGEDPQLYFDHMVKAGDAYELAGEIRKGLDLTAAR